MSLRGKCAIAGLGAMRMGKNYAHSHALGFAIEAVGLAIEDAGLNRSDIDGLLVNPGVTWSNDGVVRAPAGDGNARPAADLDDECGRCDDRFDGDACGAVHRGRDGQCGRLRVCRRTPQAAQAHKDGGSAAAYGFVRGLDAAYGLFGVNAQYALVARRHMHVYGTTNDHLGAIAVAQRQWANMNPMAQFHNEPLTFEDYHNSRWVAEPFYLLDATSFPTAPFA